jgi:hypothetical protein
MRRARGLKLLGNTTRSRGLMEPYHMVRRSDTAFLRDFVRLCIPRSAHSLVLCVEQTQEHPFVYFACQFALLSIGFWDLDTTPLSSSSATI